MLDNRFEIRRLGPVVLERMQPLESTMGGFELRSISLERTIDEHPRRLAEIAGAHGLEHEDLFTYLVRVMNFATKLGAASALSEFEDMAERVRKVLSRFDTRLLER
jgi:hypothetical protein